MYRDEYNNLIIECGKSEIYTSDVNFHSYFLTSLNQWIHLNPIHEENTKEYVEKLKSINNNLNSLKMIFRNGEEIAKSLYLILIIIFCIYIYIYRDEIKRLYNKSPPKIASYFPEHNSHIQACCRKDYSRITNNEIRMVVDDSKKISRIVDV